MTNPTAGDRRRDLRVRSRLPVLLRFQGTGDHAALARDVAAGGLGIEVRFAQQGQSRQLTRWRGRIDIEVDVPSGGPVGIAAETVWWHMDVAGEVGRYRGGLRFLDVGPSDRARLVNLLMFRANEGPRRCSFERGRPFRGRRTGH
jgi:hypothetical protein